MQARLVVGLCKTPCKFNNYQKNYSVIEKEALSLIRALQHFGVRGGLPVEVYSDHQPSDVFAFIVSESTVNEEDSLFTALQL